jgi:hypothetical protein
MYPFIVACVIIAVAFWRAMLKIIAMFAAILLILGAFALIREFHHAIK